VEGKENYLEAEAKKKQKEISMDFITRKKKVEI
jgi:hypothetical protein